MGRLDPTLASIMYHVMNGKKRRSAGVSRTHLQAKVVVSTMLLGMAMTGMVFPQASMAASQQRTASTAPRAIAVPSADALVTLSRSILVALAQANATNNYSVLHQLAGTEFQRENSPQSLSATFSAFRSNNMDISPVAVIQPQFLMSPEIRDQKLRLLGRFPSQPLGVNFDLTFAPENGRWKLRGMAVSLSQ